MSTLQKFTLIASFANIILSFHVIISILEGHRDVSTWYLVAIAALTTIASIEAWLPNKS